MTILFLATASNILKKHTEQLLKQTMHLRSLFTIGALVAQIQVAAADALELVGTWTSKSNTVFTGPGFYDPVDELLIEPDLPGISYSFTDDGHYEEALYRVVLDPRNHSCAIASVTYQHGLFELLANGLLVLTPLEVDGRQLLSDPCGDSASTSQYTRYHQPVWFKAFEVRINAYHGRYYLQLYQFDGSKMQPLYLAYKPPLMLPTEALNPTNDASKNTKRSLGERVRRSFENQYRTTAVKETWGHKMNTYWWILVGGLGVALAILFMK